MKQKLLLLLLATIISLNTGLLSFANQQPTSPEKIPQTQKEHKEELRKMFEQRLNLSEKQKEKAKAIHKQGREEIKPIMMKIALKRQEIDMVKFSKIPEKFQKEKIDKINSEISELEKQAQDIRKKNSQEFEKILNKKQRAELEKMKTEGRARFEQYHKARPPFQGLGSPSFIFRPLYPPQEQKLFN